MSITAGRHEAAETFAMPALAFELPLNNVYGEDMYASVHVTPGAVGAYELLPLLPEHIKKTGNLPERPNGIDTLNHPFVDVILAEPESAATLARALAPNRTFMLHHGWLSTIRPGQVRSLVTFETSQNNNPLDQRLALEKFIPDNKRGGIDLALRSPDGFSSVFAAALQNTVINAVRDGLSSHGKLYNESKDEMKGNVRAVAIGQAVRYGFFDTDTVPELTQFNKMTFVGSEDPFNLTK